MDQEFQDLTCTRDTLEELNENPYLLPWKVASIVYKRDIYRYNADKEYALKQIEANKYKTAEQLIQERLPKRVKVKHPSTCTLCNKEGHNRRTCSTQVRSTCPKIAT
jgi:hypothetical protein